MELTLLVIRTADIEKLVAFYQLLGLQFSRHQHYNGPYHYAAVVGKLVLEIYPFARLQTEADKNLRLGFATDDFDGIVHRLQEHHIGFTSPAQTDFGFSTVITDHDGRKIELYKNGSLNQ